MSKPAAQSPPPDQPWRERALDAGRSVLVQAPAGSGKTDLLTRRFLRLLAEVDEPGQIVAITFTIAAAAEMRHRILSELEKAAANNAPPPVVDALSTDALARRALQHSRARGWQLLDLPAQLRISTIDSFCRELALQQPLLAEFGGELDLHDQPAELYRRAARRALEKLGANDAALSDAIEDLLLWRDNGWQEMEGLLVKMLAQRDRWMHDFVLHRDSEWPSLRERLERPFASAVRNACDELEQLLHPIPGALNEAVALARFACQQPEGAQHQALAELAEFPTGPFKSCEELEEAHVAWLGLATLVLTNERAFRKQINKTHGFPADRKNEKLRLLALIQKLQQVDGLAVALAAVRNLPPSRYTDDDWQIVRACFTLLRHAAVELRVVFAETGAVDFTEVAQIAQRVLRGEDGQPTDAAFAVADGIRHLLVDEFQDTSRRQHQLLASLIAAWPDPSGRTVFVVGDPMQSIYFFRDADAELFPRVKATGLEIPGSAPLIFDLAPLTANFRTEPALVNELNDAFAKIFAADDGSGVTFSPAQPARDPGPDSGPRLALHLNFAPQISRVQSANPASAEEKVEAERQRDAARDAQIAAIVALIRRHMPRMQEAQARGDKYRIAVLGRARKSLAPIAQALRDSAIPFRAVELEKLKDRPEVLDALSLGCALLNPQDRVAWFGVLRAPWCGLALDDLYTLSSADQGEVGDVIDRPIAELLASRLLLLSDHGRRAAGRVLRALQTLPAFRAANPTVSLGTWLQQAWLSLGGPCCVDATARANLDLLWSCLDALPGGEQDLLSPALDAALDRLTALPDPVASSECGVQLMTIHKSKGLEFEVVIVPDLQARGGSKRAELLSWLERGLAEPDASGDITEFLVAPMPRKGADNGTAKAWVDRVYRERESQETRRILYVASTRARVSLHLFARPEYKNENGALTLVEPKNNLLAPAWPAIEDEVRARFAAWIDDHAKHQADVHAIAAGEESNLLVMPSAAQPTLLRRLPLDFEPPPMNAGIAAAGNAANGEPSFAATGDSQLYDRHEGGVLSRASGTAVHTLLQELARLRQPEDGQPSRAALSRLLPRIAAQVRSAGFEPPEAGSLAATALEIALNAAQDPYGQWILSPHADAASEVAWTGVVAGAVRTVRVDRMFRAGPEPLANGENTWWIIDYKTAHADLIDKSAALPELRRLFAPQLGAYATVLRGLRGSGSPIRAGLYYPRMLLFDWWEL